jgi:hypothetical protein
MDKPKQFRLTKKKEKSFTLKSYKDRSTKDYGSEWKRYRYRFIHHNNKCYACGTSGKERQLHVDHIQTVRNNPELFWEPTNHIALCINCHSTVTGKFDMGKTQDLEGKLKWLARKREIHCISHKSIVLDTSRHVAREKKSSCKPKLESFG